MNKSYSFALSIISLICFTVVSTCLFGMFFIETTVDSPPSKLNLFCGIGFWLFTILGILLQIVVSRNIKRWYERKRLYRSRFRRTKIGLLTFFSNLPAIISDIVLVVSLITFIVIMIIDSTSILAYISLSVLFLSFSAHCIFNGKNYYYITNYERIKAQLTKMEE